MNADMDKWKLDDGQVGLLQRYVRAVAGWPGNLTSFNQEQIWTRGIEESLAILDAVPDEDQPAVDIGSGAGFPGLVLAIARPGWSWTLIESRLRRADFLLSVVDGLGLQNVRVIQGRAEEWIQADPARRECAQTVTARAVAPLRKVLELGLPFVRRGGRLVIPTGRGGLGQVAELRAWAAELGGSMLVRAGGTSRDAGGVLVVVDKVGVTNRRFPRIGKALGR
ncbi:MAG: 16S rRNA (guanine(527)-N(7))-methyltransferase RsmG [Thermaerobacter sp.]|nr:16S rRNA (guanine(527)-N(7))-methyltransferase RsmG [Thermaerobacter sp.]